ncbi:hypothetical protein RHMOL_Rhmol11G0272700 [Rhododendron molle]|uniref:Uncharacterized protein n=1 Tax=Rhododendron molle TaxID=49168 RepID=A0ACC0LXY2_RHOML|nr:hypothetical protein RHMOL_Rhmol11G0272700 [Rhododendron molle]
MVVSKPISYVFDINPPPDVPSDDYRVPCTLMLSPIKHITFCSMVMDVLMVGQIAFVMESNYSMPLQR